MYESLSSILIRGGTDSQGAGGDRHAKQHDHDQRVLGVLLGKFGNVLPLRVAVVF
jgi:hypothetical protein